MGFSRQEYWGGLPFPCSGDLPDPGIEPGFPTLEADALTSEPSGKPMILGGDQLSARIDLGLHLLVYILVSQSVIFTYFLSHDT